jgi:hypothetical protein
MANEENDFSFINDFENLNDQEEQELEEEVVEEVKPKTVAKTVATTVRKRLPQRKRVTVVETQIQTNEEINKFYRGRERDPAHYSYTPEGNLQIKGVKGVSDTVIRLEKKFVSLKPQELEEIMEERRNELKAREKNYEIALQVLRQRQEEYANGEISAESVVLANTAVQQASQIRSKVAYPEMWTSIDVRPVTKSVLMNYEPYEERKMPYPVYLFKHHDISRMKAWGSYKGQADEEEVMEGGGIRIRFITDLEDKSTGHFHPYFQRNFVFNETEYISPYQAYQGERFKELGLDDLRNQVLGTRSGRTLHSISLKEKRVPNQPQQLWEDILFQFFHQHEDLAKELNATGTDKFHVMDKQIAAEYGPALEKARLRLREAGEKDVDHQEVKEKAITEEEQKKAKVGAIIRNFRRRM